jgi:hypothetical protein
MAGVILASPAQALTFSNDFTDPSWASAPTILSEMEIAVPAAENILDALFSNPVNVSIYFFNDPSAGGAYTEFNGQNFPAPFSDPFPSGGVSYATVVSDLTSHSAAHPENKALAASIMNLPASEPPCPTCDTAEFMMPDTESLALTGQPAPGGPYQFQAAIAVGDLAWDDNQSDGIAAGAGDLTGVMLHEITHAMGRVDFAFAGSNGPDGAPGDPLMTPLDLDRYGCGTTSLTTSSDNACLSIDGGVTDLNQFAPTSDTGDWLSPGAFTPTADSFNASFYYGQLLTMSAGDILEMNALGWDPFSSSVPEPAAWVLLLAGFAGLGFARYRRSRAAAAA